MPRVKWGYLSSPTSPNSLSWTAENHGGCFGFAGRYSIPDVLRSKRPKVFRYLFKYDINHSHQGNDVPLAGILGYLTHRSPWSSYVIGIEGSTHVDIRTDIPGHAVIGVASIYRSVCRSDYRHEFTRTWNYLVNNGVNETIAFLMAYLMKANSDGTY
ncbi:hypothetical protein, partial [Burkholderia vietnamiensis]|uniref:hypothetical protein n=1 Tax=Burkholderia vietnamiensis TaxID=60552 RepID=UPI00352F1B11